jgi:hypothetical protein
MESIDTYFIAEIISAVAVVTSLVHLGIQIRQTRIQSIKESMDKITQERADFIKLLATESELSQIVASGLSSTSKLKAKEYFRFTSYLYYLFVQLELGYRKWKRGHIDDELWNAWNEGVRWWIRCPGTRSWWETNPAGGFTSEFKEYINKIIESVTKESPELFSKQLDFLEKISAKKK